MDHDLDVHGLLAGPCGIVYLPTHYGEVVYTNIMIYDAGMVIDGGRGPKVFPELFTKDSCRLTNVFLMSIWFVTLVHIDYSAFLCDPIPILLGHQEVLGGLAALKTDLHPLLTTNVLEAFAPCVWYYYVDVDIVVVVIVGGSGVVVVDVFGMGDAVSIVVVYLESV